MRNSRFYINTKLQLFIKYLFDRFPNLHKLISSIYKLFSSTYYRILKLKILNSRTRSLKEIWFLKNFCRMLNFWSKSWLTLLDFKLLSESWWLVWIQSWEQKNHIIDWEYLSRKDIDKSTNKGWAQSHEAIDSNKAVEANKLFCYKQLDLLYQQKYIMNIDEWRYSHYQAGLLLTSIRS